MSLYLVLFGALAMVFIVTIPLSFDSDFQSWLMGRLAKRVGLGVPVELDSLIRSRVKSRAIGTSIGGLAGMAVAAVVYSRATANGSMRPFADMVATHDVLIVVYGALAITAAGAAMGGAAASLRFEARPTALPTVARLRVTKVRDFVPPVLHQGAWLMVALAVVTISMIVAAAGPRSRVDVSASIILAVVGLLALVIFEVMGHHIVERGRRSNGTDELVWDDALRSEALRELIHGPLLGIMLGTLWSLALAVNEVHAPWAFLPGIAAVVVFVIFSNVFRGTSKWYLEELWPGARRRTPEEEERRIQAVRAS